MYAIANLVVRLVDFYGLLVMIHCVLSWFPVGPGLLYDVKEVIARLVEPYLGIFRSLIPPLGGVDFSPVVAMVALGFAERLLVGVLV